MDVKYERKPAMTFIGFHTRIAPDEGKEKCPAFWEQEYALKYARLWQTMEPQTPVEAAILENGIGMYAICLDGEAGFTYWIAGLYQGGDVPQGLELCSFPAGTWAAFSAKGPLMATLQPLNDAVMQQWLPEEGRKRQANGSVMLEIYSAGDPRSPDYECGIWMPVGDTAAD